MALGDINIQPDASFSKLPSNIKDGVSANPLAMTVK
jgi:hypothetical protein